MIELTLPWDVLVPDNQRKGGLVGHLTKRYRSAKRAAEVLLMGQVRRPRPRFDSGPVELRLRFYPPDKHKRDMKNLTKLLTDAMEKLVYDDDYQIASLSWLRMEPDRDNPRVEIRVQPMPKRAA